MRRLPYAHVDVFAKKQMEGNGLAVVFCDGALSEAQMLQITREFKQFETIFLSDGREGCVKARIFTLEGELPFAGHPVLGAAAALHARQFTGREEMALTFQLMQKDVQVVSQRVENGHFVQMRQGVPSFLGEIRGEEDVAYLLRAHGLRPEMLAKDLPIAVVSTGLPYVIIPVTEGLAQARITVGDLEMRIAAFGASYTYLLNVQTLQARTWDNLGLVEDTATGSAAGPSCAYLVRHGRLAEGREICIRQGEYAGHPGFLHAVQKAGEIYVSGQVLPFAQGEITLA